jgi:hypothetical protein
MDRVALAMITLALNALEHACQALKIMKWSDLRGAAAMWWSHVLFLPTECWVAELIRMEIPMELRGGELRDL